MQKMSIMEKLIQISRRIVNESFYFAFNIKNSLLQIKKISLSGKKIWKMQGFLLEADCFKVKTIVK